MFFKSKTLIAVLVIIFNTIAFSQENTANDKRVIITKKISTGRNDKDQLDKIFQVGFLSVELVL